MEYNTWYAPLSGVPSPNFGKSTACQTIEIFQYEGESEPRIIEGEVNDSTLTGWLDNGLSTISKPRAPVSGLRVLVGNLFYEPREITVTKESSLFIEQHFDLHENFWSCIRTERSYASQYRTLRASNKLNSDVYRLFFKTPWSSTTHFQLSLTYSPLAHLTTVFLIISDSFPNPTVMLTFLKSQAKFHTCPLLLPVLLAETFINHKWSRSQKFSVKIDDIGNAVGQQRFLGKTAGNMLETNFEETITRLNICGTTLEGYLYRIKSMRVATVNFQAWGNMVDSSPSQELSNHQSQDEVKNMVLDKLSSLRDDCDDLLLKLNHDKSRIQILLQVVYQFTAQKEARINTSLAKTSTAIAKASKADSEVMKVIAIQTKRDSSAMKTIAILGMLFLPGTFIAAILSMPVFDLSDTPGGVIKHGFKIYWALTVSLTVMVFLCWIVAVTVPWRKLVGKVGWRKRFFGPNTDVVNLELDAEGDGESESESESPTQRQSLRPSDGEDRGVQSPDREKDGEGPVGVIV